MCYSAVSSPDGGWNGNQPSVYHRVEDFSFSEVDSYLDKSARDFSIIGIEQGEEGDVVLCSVRQGAGLPRLPSRLLPSPASIKKKKN